MNFSGLKRLIESADQQSFYDVALLLLEQLGYRELNVVDGPNDGGKDVESNRKNVQIQLSVRKDWEKKIREEASKAIKNAKTHLVFVTNRHITQVAEAKFRRGFAERSEIELTIFDSNRIATNLSAPGRIAKSYSLLGVDIKVRGRYSVKDIAASVALLFGDEALELREKTVDSFTISWLRRNRGAADSRLIEAVASLLPGANPERLVNSSVSRLRGKGAIVGTSQQLELSESEKARVDSAESELCAARTADLQVLSERFELPASVAEQLLDIVIELTLRSNRAGWTSAIDDDLKGFLKSRGLTGRKNELNEVVSNLSTVTKFGYIGTIDKVFSTNTFDIFRAMGGSADIKIVLDTSVALPLVFSLEFGARISGYSSASFGMKGVADSHGFPMLLPRPYLNEMASHGFRALEFVESYKIFEPELRGVMRSSPNAFVSHYAAISERAHDRGDKILGFSQFLEHFGVRSGSTIGNAERVIQGILESHQISVDWDGRFDGDLRQEIADKKKNYPEVLIRHDAAVCTHIRNDIGSGHIFATWDRILIDLLQGTLRIYAESPGRIVDWLSFTQGIESGIDGSLEMMSALAIVDEGAASRVAEKLLQISESEQAYKLNEMIRVARAKTSSSDLGLEEIEQMIDVELSELGLTVSSVEALEGLGSVPEEGRA
jgi:Restriction endonuclease